MKDRVLIVTSSYDRTCDYLISKYKDVKFFRFNMDRFSAYKISVTSTGFSISDPFTELTSHNCKSIYFRKPTHENLGEVYDAKYHQFSYRESYSLIEGLVEYFPGKCLSKPSIMRRAGNKVFQALVAKEIGLRIPTLSITNSVTSVKKISEDETIVKPLSVGSIVIGKRKEYVQTNLYDEKFDLSLLKYTPAYFQRFVEKDYEVRVTFIDSKAYCVRIDSEDTVDWRKPGNTVAYRKWEIPEAIYTKCLLYLKTVDMCFGCFDFIVRDEQWYFLEMNSNGQWAWLELETGLPISKGIMSYLND